jgi:hypothetical protein
MIRAEFLRVSLRTKQKPRTLPRASATYKKHAGRNQVGPCLTAVAHRLLPACSFVNGRYAIAQTLH